MSSILESRQRWNVFKTILYKILKFLNNPQSCGNGQVFLEKIDPLLEWVNFPKNVILTPCLDSMIETQMHVVTMNDGETGWLVGRNEGSDHDVWMGENGVVLDDECVFEKLKILSGNHQEVEQEYSNVLDQVELLLKCSNGEYMVVCLIQSYLDSIKAEMEVVNEMNDFCFEYLDRIVNNETNANYFKMKYPEEWNSEFIEEDAIEIESISAPKKKKKRGTLPKPATRYLMKWLSDHLSNPYPSNEEKEEFKRITKLTAKQINDWFTNARRRHVPKLKVKKLDL